MGSNTRVITFAAPTLEEAEDLFNSWSEEFTHANVWGVDLHVPRDTSEFYIIFVTFDIEET